MHPILSQAELLLDDTVALIRELVECESPSHDADAIGRFQKLFTGKLAGLGTAREIPGPSGSHLRCEMDLPGEQKEGQILVLGHADTVYPLGTLSAMPCRMEDGCLFGPGTFDMKGGLAQFLCAVRILRELALPVKRKVVLLVVADEEVGSQTSRAITEAEAANSVAAIVVEPSAGAEGMLKSGRKGVGLYRLRVHGRASHAGLDFEKGASAVLEMARQIEKIAALTDLSKGTTVNPGVVRGGTRSNVVAEMAELEIDVRAATATEAQRVHQGLYGLEPAAPEFRLEMTGGVNRPPMDRERNLAIVGLAQVCARELGFEVGETVVGGGSDGNFTSGMGVPTLDGMGAVGDGAHSVLEHLIIGEIPKRAALLASVLTRL